RSADLGREAQRKLTASESAVIEAQKPTQQAVAAVAQARAARGGAAVGIDQARQERSRAQALLAQYADRNARLSAAEATVESAELDVNYCRVRAPFDAYVTNLNIAVGEYARQGQQVFALVDDRAWYVLANFRETYVGVIKPGMVAEVYLMSYPNRRFRGVVRGYWLGDASRPGRDRRRAPRCAAHAQLGAAGQSLPGTDSPRGAGPRAALSHGSHGGGADPGTVTPLA